MSTTKKRNLQKILECTKNPDKAYSYCFSLAARCKPPMSINTLFVKAGSTRQTPHTWKKRTRLKPSLDLLLRITDVAIKNGVKNP